MPDLFSPLAIEAAFLFSRTWMPPCHSGAKLRCGGAGGRRRYSECGDRCRRSVMMNPALTGRDVMEAEGRKNDMPRERRH